jgi:tetratricopeptide (TPR) repeat protein
MATYSSASHQDDPLFQSALKHMQGGDLRTGLSELDNLIKKYPASEDLRTLKKEMQLRFRVDDYERVELKQDQQSRIKKYLLWGALAVLFVALFSWGVWMYAGWMQQQVVAAREKLQGQISLVETSVKLKDAQNFMQAGDGAQALTIFQEVAASHPEIDGLDAWIQQAEKLVALNKKYDEAMRLINLNDQTGALALLEEIETEDAFFKDVPLRVEQIKGQFMLADILTEAEAAFQAGNWEESASKYESVRAIDPQYKTEFIEDRLFNSYINLASSALDAQSDSYDNLQIAETNFRKALALRPQDKEALAKRELVRDRFKVSLSKTYVEAAQAAISDEADSLLKLKVAEEYFRKALALQPNDSQILLQQELAMRFLKAQGEFENERWDEAISDLEFVNNADPNYALGTSRQTLYEAYMARGKANMAGGSYETALEDFQKAAVLVDENPETIIPSYTAKINIAEATGMLGDYESSVFVYRDALDMLDLNQLALDENSKARRDLETAEHYADIRYYRSAYRYFKSAAPAILDALYTTIHVVESGEYLTQLANRYHTTTEAILKVNNLGNPKQVRIGQELIIPGTAP